MNKKMMCLAFIVSLLSLFTFTFKVNAAGTVMCLYSTVDPTDTKEANANVGAAIILDGNKFYIHFSEDNLEYLINSDWRSAQGLNLGDPDNNLEMIYNSLWSRPDKVQHELEWRSYGSYGTDSDGKTMLRDRGICPKQISGPKTIDETGIVQDKRRTRIYLYSEILDDGEVSPNYYLYWSAMDPYYTQNARAIYTEANSNLCGLNDEQINFLTNALTFQINIQKISGITKHKFAVFLSPENGDFNLENLAKNIIVKYESQTCVALKDNPLYKDLYNAAKEFDYYYDINNVLPNGDKTTSCKKLLGDPDDSGSFAYYLHFTFKTIRFAGPIIVIALTTFDYISIVASGASDKLKKANRRTVTRIIVMLALFILPIIIEVVLKIVGLYGDCGIK